MSVARQTSPHFILVIQVDFSDGYTDAIFGNCHGNSPWINNHGFSITISFTTMMSKLTGGKYPGLVLDGSGSKEWSPVIFTGL